MAGSIVEGITAGFMDVEAAASNIHFDNDSSVVLGIMFIIISLLCRYGAELNHNADKNNLMR